MEPNLFYKIDELSRAKLGSYKLAFDIQHKSAVSSMDWCSIFSPDKKGITLPWTDYGAGALSYDGSVYFSFSMAEEHVQIIAKVIEGDDLISGTPVEGYTVSITQSGDLLRDGVGNTAWLDNLNEGLKNTIVFSISNGSEDPEEPEEDDPLNKYEEYLYINGEWEKLGNSAVDLTGYATEEYVDTKFDSVQEPDLTNYIKNDFEFIDYEFYPEYDSYVIKFDKELDEILENINEIEVPDYGRPVKWGRYFNGDRIFYLRNDGFLYFIEQGHWGSREFIVNTECVSNSNDVYVYKIEENGTYDYSELLSNGVFSHYNFNFIPNSEAIIFEGSYWFGEGEVDNLNAYVNGNEKLNMTFSQEHDEESESWGWIHKPDKITIKGFCTPRPYDWETGAGGELEYIDMSLVRLSDYPSGIGFINYDEQNKLDQEFPNRDWYDRVWIWRYREDNYSDEESHYKETGLITTSYWGSGLINDENGNIIPTNVFNDHFINYDVNYADYKRPYNTDYDPQGWNGVSAINELTKFYSWENHYELEPFSFIRNGIYYTLDWDNSKLYAQKGNEFATYFIEKSSETPDDPNWANYFMYDLSLESYTTLDNINSELNKTIKNEPTDNVVIEKIRSLTRAEYDDLEETNDNTIYYINDEVGGGSDYELPAASTDTLGGVKVDGASITVTSDGTISAAPSTITADTVLLTQAEYDALTNPDPNRLYVIVV